MLLNPAFSQKVIDPKGRLPETKCTISRSDVPDTPHILHPDTSHIPQILI